MVAGLAAVLAYCGQPGRRTDIEGGWGHISGFLTEEERVYGSMANTIEAFYFRFKKNSGLSISRLRKLIIY